MRGWQRGRDSNSSPSVSLDDIIWGSREAVEDAVFSEGEQTTGEVDVVVVNRRKIQEGGGVEVARRKDPRFHRI